MECTRGRKVSSSLMPNSSVEFINNSRGIAALCVQLITKEDTSEELRRVTVSSLGDFVTHFAPNPSKAKQYLQVLFEPLWLLVSASGISVHGDRGGSKDNAGATWSCL